jgi:hypothetical protein
VKKTTELMGRMTRREMKRVAGRREKVTMEKNMARRNRIEEITKHLIRKRSS